MTARDKNLHSAKQLIAAAYAQQCRDDRRRAAILKHFKTGARRPWGRRIWRDVRSLRGGSNQALAAWLCTAPDRVREGLNNGSLSIENLVVMFAGLRPLGGKLPELPPEKELAQNGFIEAMLFLREPAHRAENHQRLSPEDLAALVSLLSEKDWFKFETQRERAALANDRAGLHEAEAKLESLAVQISAAASRRVDAPIRRTCQELRELQRTWADLWTECRNEVPFVRAENR